MNIMNWNPHITVAAIIERDNKFLMVAEKINNQIVYNQPAGHWEPKETLIEASIRETLEESAWLYEPTAIVGVYVYQTPDGITYQRFCFTGKPKLFYEKQPLADEIHYTTWLSFDELSRCVSQHRSPLVLQCVKDYLSGACYPLQLISDLRTCEN